MKQFIHTPLQTTLPELECITTPTERFYVTPNGDRYPSITHVLSILSNGIIENWRKRIGEKEAQKISEHASNRGTDLHSALEAHLKNETPNFPDDPRSKVRIMFNRIKRVLSKVDNIVAQEIPLYSDALRVAGRCDVIAEYNGVLSIIDFKGATKAKKKDWIKSYFLQTTGYSLMFQERTGIAAEQIVILMSGEEDFSCQIFVEQRDKYVQPLKETINLFTAKQ